MLCESDAIQGLFSICLSNRLVLGPCGQHYCIECLSKYGILTEDMIFSQPDSGRLLRQTFKLPYIVLPRHRDQCPYRDEEPLGGWNGHSLTVAFLDATLAALPTSLPEGDREYLSRQIGGQIKDLHNASQLYKVVSRLDAMIEEAMERHGGNAREARRSLDPTATAFEPGITGQWVGPSRLVPAQQHVLPRRTIEPVRLMLHRQLSNITQSLANIERGIARLERAVAALQPRQDPQT